MEKSKIFIVVDNIELRDGDKVKGFCGLFFDAEEALQFVIDNQKKSNNLELMTFDNSVNIETVPVSTPLSDYDYWRKMSDQYPLTYQTITTNGSGICKYLYPERNTTCTIQVIKK